VVHQLQAEGVFLAAEDASAAVDKAVLVDGHRLACLLRVEGGLFTLGPRNSVQCVDVAVFCHISMFLEGVSELLVHKPLNGRSPNLVLRSFDWLGLRLWSLSNLWLILFADDLANSSLEGHGMQVFGDKTLHF